MFAKLKELRELSVSDNQLSALPTDLFRLTTLEILDLNGNQLTYLPSELRRLKKLRGLRVSRNRLQRISDVVCELRTLRELDLSFNQLTELPDLAALSELQQLDVSHNRLDALPIDIGQIKELRLLNLAENKLTDLPFSLLSAKSLRLLYLYGNRDLGLPRDLVEGSENNREVDVRLLMAALEHHYRFRIALQQEGSAPVRERISHALKAEVHELDLSGLGLEKLPGAVGLLPNLRSLNIGDNRISDLHDPLGCLAVLRQLRHLSISANALKSLPTEMFDLTALEVLDIGGNELDDLPSQIGNLQKLRKLQVSRNRLTKLPDAVCELSALAELDVSYNQLGTLPEPLTKLLNLERLDISHNRLTTLHTNIGQLEQLKQINAAQNELKDLPLSLSSSTSIRRLYLHGNTDLGLPAEILGPPHDDMFADHARAEDIVGYYFRSRQHARPLNEAKLILVGRGMVGKTSIVNRLVHNKFERHEGKTQGIQITNWRIRLDRGEEVRLNVWDFGGQEIMHATHQFFLTRRSLYLLVLSGREGTEEADAEYWLRLIESFGEDSPVIIVLNKSLEHAFDLNRRGLQQKFVGIREWIATDCEQGLGIEELQRAISRETDRLPNLRDEFPARWFAIKERISGMQQSFMSYHEYRDECARLGEHDESAQETLAIYLHHLGVALNFREDTRLRDTHILNPHWVTKGIYGILNSGKLAQQNGEIWVDDLQ
ncbi:MAG: leucine-rich repeat domain-containing protein, partial [Nitrospirota bacterium]